MVKTKSHTPGPWGWFRGHLVTVRPDMSVPLNAKIVMTKPDDLSDADAALMASAPELLGSALALDLLIGYVEQAFVDAKLTEADAPNLFAIRRNLAKTKSENLKTIANARGEK